MAVGDRKLRQATSFFQKIHPFCVLLHFGAIKLYTSQFLSFQETSIKDPVALFVLFKHAYGIVLANILVFY